MLSSFLSHSLLVYTCCVSSTHTSNPSRPNCILLIPSLPCPYLFFLSQPHPSRILLFSFWYCLSPFHLSSSFVTDPYQSHPFLIVFIPLVFFFIHPQLSQFLLNLCSSQPYPSLRSSSFSSEFILFFSTSSFISTSTVIIWKKERTRTIVYSKRQVTYIL